VANRYDYERQFDQSKYQCYMPECPPNNFDANEMIQHFAVSHASTAFNPEHMIEVNAATNTRNASEAKLDESDLNTSNPFAHLKVRKLDNNKCACPLTEKSECTRAFNTAREARNHAEKLHCPICYKFFTLQVNMEQHKQIHAETGLKEVVDPVKAPRRWTCTNEHLGCTSTFGRGNDMRRHAANSCTYRVASK